MRVTRKYDQHRRDLTIDMKCENCEAVETNHYAYDDRNYWDNVVPSMKCAECDKSSKDLGSEKEHVSTKYADYEIV